MTETTHIVPVGHTKEKLIEGIRRFPVSKVILLIGDKPDLPGEREAVKTAEDIEKAFRGSAEIEKKKVSKEDVYSAALAIIELIKKEKDKERRVLINVSGSMRTLGIACYIAACMTNTESYATLSKYEEGKVIGVEKVYPLPLFTYKEPPPERMDVLSALKQGEVNSVEELIERMKPELDRTSKDFDNERSRMSYHLRALKEEGLIKTEKDGKNLKIQLTKKGKIITP